MKTILPWIIAAIAVAGGVFLYTSIQSKSAEVATLQQQVQELTGLHSELEELKKGHVPADELARLRKNAEDLVRLRNSVQKLTEEKSQLSQQKQQAHSEAELARTQIQAAQADAAQAQARAEQARAAALINQVPANIDTNALARMTPEQRAAFAERFGLPGSPEARVKAQANGCINNMRQIDGAIQQWALENKKRDTDPPDRVGFVQYIRGNTLPTCPAGGAYSIAATVGSVPIVTCTQPGHALAQ